MPAYHSAHFRTTEGIGNGVDPLMNITAIGSQNNYIMLDWIAFWFNQNSTMRFKMCSSFTLFFLKCLQSIAICILNMMDLPAGSCLKLGKFYCNKVKGRDKILVGGKGTSTYTGGYVPRLKLYGLNQPIDFGPKDIHPAIINYATCVSRISVVVPICNVQYLAA